jgi:hypothetical protein
MYALGYERTNGRTYACMLVMDVGMHVMHVCVCVWVDVCMYACVGNVWMYACMCGYVCMHVDDAMGESYHHPNF